MNTWKQIPKGVEKRLSKLSANGEIFEQNKEEYQAALQKTGHDYKLEYIEQLTSIHHVWVPYMAIYMPYMGFKIHTWIVSEVIVFLHLGNHIHHIGIMHYAWMLCVIRNAV